MFQIASYLVAAVISVIILVPLMLVLSLRIQPKPFSAYPEPAQALRSVSLPGDLPAPVARYYETIGMGEQVPLIESAVISARGRLRFAGITFPARLRFTHDAGQGYRHDIEATVFGYPLMKVNETYLDGRARMALPIGVIENEPKVDMAANLGLWGESVWLPSIFITDSRVRWEPVNDRSARLIVPFGSKEDAFIVYFDANTGLITHMEAMRFKQAADEEKTAWRLDFLNWGTFDGILIPSSSTITWADEGTPWLVINIEDIAYNVDMADYMRSTGP